MKLPLIFMFLVKIFKPNYDHSLSVNFIPNDSENMDIYERFEFYSLKNNTVMQKFYLNKIKESFKKNITKSRIELLQQEIDEHFKNSNEYFKQADEALKLLEDWDMIELWEELDKYK